MDEMRKGLTRIFFAFAALAAFVGSASGSEVKPDSLNSANTFRAAGIMQAQAVTAQAVKSCPTRAIFLRLLNEIRGYPLEASGPTAPCQRLADKSYGSITVSDHGFLHALSFQSGSLAIFPPDATGNVAPNRAVSVDQDHISVALDSHVNDFVVAGQAYMSQNCWYVIPNSQTSSSRSNCDGSLAFIQALATTPNDELVVVGIDALSKAGRIDVFSNPASGSLKLLRSIVGPATGLATASANRTSYYFSVAFSVATDPVSGDIYVYSHDLGAATAPKILQFPVGANGNAAPLRTLSGPRTNLPTGQLGAFAVDVLALDDKGNLYVTSPGSGNPNPGLLVSVFDRRASGNATPVRTFWDPTASVGTVGVGSAVRTRIQ